MYCTRDQIAIVAMFFTGAKTAVSRVIVAQFQKMGTVLSITCNGGQSVDKFKKIGKMGKAKKPKSLRRIAHGISSLVFFLQSVTLLLCRSFV